MLIDWFTVVAQIINFLLLIGLLKYFLYDRIIRAMEEREEKIRARLEEAENKKQEAESEAVEYRRKQQEIESKRSDMLSQAREEAEERREELTRNARQEAENLRYKWMQALQRGKTSFLREIRQLAGKEVYDVSRRALKDLAHASLEEQIIEVFLERFREMGKEELKDLSKIVQKAGSSVRIRSAFEIPARLRRRITTALREALGDHTEVEYDTDPDMIPGIKLNIHGRKVSWSLEDYLDTLEKKTRDLLDREARVEGRGEEEGKHGGKNEEH